VKKYRIDTSAGEAESDIQEIFDFIKEDSPENAIKWYFNIQDKILTLTTLANRCPKAPESELVSYTVYHLIVGNYRVLYRIEEDTVQILHVRGKGQKTYM